MESDNYSVLYTISEDSITEEVESNVKNEIIVTEIDAGDIVVVQKDMNDQQPSEIVTVKYETIEEIVMHDWTNGNNEVLEAVEESINAPLEQLASDEEVIKIPVMEDEYLTSRPFPCDFCSRRFRKKANQINHMVSHKNDRPHVCNICGARYIRKCDLMNHLKLHALSDDNFNDDQFTGNCRGERDNDEDSENANLNESHICRQCNARFDKSRALATHSRIHHRYTFYDCQYCEESLWDRDLLIDHCKKVHKISVKNVDFTKSTKAYCVTKNSRNLPNDSDIQMNRLEQVDYICNFCDAAFANLEMLKNHRMKHVSDMVVDDCDDHVCDQCGETFLNAADLLGHLEEHKSSNEPRQCMLCGHEFIDELSVQSHIAEVHLDNMPLNTCHICGKTLKDRKRLLNHVVDHNSEKWLRCSVCDKQFMDQNRLKRHMATHRDKSVKCTKCNLVFPDGRSFSNHRHQHNPNTVRLFPCHICNKTFGTRSSQLIHIRLHTGEKPFGCTYCFKSFRDGGTLRKHIRIHTGEKPYGCVVCSRAFNQRVVLRDHIRSIHSAPNSGSGTSTEPYSCSVCSTLFTTAESLVKHLIQHCDDNTTLSRKPPGYTGTIRPANKSRKQQAVQTMFIESDNSEDLDDVKVIIEDNSVSSGEPLTMHED